MGNFFKIQKLLKISHVKDKHFSVRVPRTLIFCMSFVITVEFLDYGLRCFTNKLPIWYFLENLRLSSLELPCKDSVTDEGIMHAAQRMSFFTT